MRNFSHSPRTRVPLRCLLNVITREGNFDAISRRLNPYAETRFGEWRRTAAKRRQYNGS